mmetsp:Transcript_43184/g.94046  ORF Transcript_43184/g.94046 Transcript_43184/m.94046 type:complete len:682 (+) Transcript_43184:106-2151(+)|eukprot:CAMPEP_0204254656 /NCGR_PEP_ID=MMETSP0468-20130131/2672_1 /ASSEMBLY_ACC=CAM_ASM_000383 /TAXON_ID=2969 /ORGANISM="Oxyrrhis marina" /LENGTH=681 /DNA_ID=CAMNT_0051228421 /DNA_START=110 /DNA_END=2155 /DNA_ORIENTATION=-
MRCVVGLSVLLSASGHSVTPIQKVITMFTTLISEIRSEAASEAATYNTFACHCRSKIAEKSTAIESESTAVDTRVAQMEQHSADKKAHEKRIQHLTQEIASVEGDLSDERRKWSEYMAQYTAEHTDMVAACDALHNAIDLITSKMPAPSLLQVELKQTLSPVLVLADAYGLASSAAKHAVAFLQGDVPDSDYDFHSGGIVDTLNKLEADFLAEKGDMEAEHDKRTSAHNEYMSGLNTQLKTSKSSKESSEESLAQTETDLGISSRDLTEQQSLLFDDQLYLKELTSKCEEKAKEWDQRTDARSGELGALEQALTIIQGTVSDNASSAARAFVQVQPSHSESSLSLVQVQEHEEARLRLHSGRSAAAALLSRIAAKTGSSELAELSHQVRVDPFAKIKKLIQGLIERLLKEAAEEATQKGFCDTEVGKARLTRDTEVDNVNEVSAVIKETEAQRRKLQGKIGRLADELSDLRSDLDTTTTQREAEKEENQRTLSSAEEGKIAVTQAIKILKEHYAGMKTKARVADGGNAVLLQGSPVDAAAGAAGGKNGSYGGAQKRAGGIIDMLEVIKSDFERAMKQTSSAESEAHADFVDFSKATKSAIADKDTAKRNAEHDFAEATAELEENIENLRQHQTLVDVALQQLDKLRPACIDTGMTHEERKARRDEEIAALKNALTMLGGGL